MNKLQKLMICMASALLAPALASAQDAPKAMYAVVSKELPGVTLYDAASDAQLCQVQTGVAPHEAAFSADGRMLYLPIYSSANIGQEGPNGHTIDFIRTSDCGIEFSLDTGDYLRPHFIEQAPSGLLYVTAEMNEAILVVDPAKREIVATLPTGSKNTHFFAMTGDESKIFTSNVGDRTLSVIDIPSKSLLTTIDAGASNQRMTVSPDNRWFVTSLWQSGQIAFYRTADQELDFTVPIEGSPFVGRFSPDSRFLYDMGTARGAGRGPGTIRVWKIDVNTHEAVANSTATTLGTGTGGLQVNPVNGQIYLTAYSGTVSVLDPDSLELLRQFETAPTPDGLFFWAPKQDN
jgi:DNA-binding beta-propeller fold protein YncE